MLCGNGAGRVVKRWCVGSALVSASTAWRGQGQSVCAWRCDVAALGYNSMLSVSLWAAPVENMNSTAVECASWRCTMHRRDCLCVCMNGTACVHDRARCSVYARARGGPWSVCGIQCGIQSVRMLVGPGTLPTGVSAFVSHGNLITLKGPWNTAVRSTL
jgi:hypothetical protein